MVFHSVVRSVLAWICAALLGLSPARAEVVSSGSGFFVNDQGWIVTNAHVAAPCRQIEVAGFGMARDITIDDKVDVAVLRVLLPRAVRPLPLRTTAPRLAEDVVALGFPLANVLSAAVKATTGSVSARAGIGDDPRFLQISAPVQPGNSGGPVIDRNGAVLGVVTAILSDSAYDRAQNVNFALRVAEVTRFLDRNRVAYSVADPLAVPQGDLPDRVEKVAEATVLLLCHAGGSLREVGRGDAPRPRLGDLRPEAAPPAPPEPPVADAVPPAPVASDAPDPTIVAGLVQEDGVDILGYDYRTLPDLDVSACAQACGEDDACRAYAHDRRGGLCTLKTGATLLLRSAEVVSGYRPDLAATLQRSDFTLAPETDSPGSDYARLGATGFVPCYLECTLNATCRAFSHDSAAQICTLKTAAGDRVATAGVTLGFR